MMFNNYYDPTSFASHTQLTQATGQIAYQVLRRACEDVRKAPARLPLWSLRIAQHVCRGALRYNEAWTRLRDAAREDGATESTVTRTLYHSFASAQIVEDQPPALSDLATWELT